MKIKRATRYGTLFFLLVTLLCISCKKPKTRHELLQDSIRKILDETPIDEHGRIAKQTPYPEPLPDSVLNRSLENGKRSLDGLFQQVLIAIVKKDTSKLNSFLVSKEEYEKWLWPEFAESRPIINFPFWLAWQEMKKKRFNGLSALLNDDRKYQKLTLKSYSFSKPSDDYQTYKLLKGLVINAQNEKGDLIEIDEFGSILELNEKYKILSYGK